MATKKFKKENHPELKEFIKNLNKVKENKGNLRFINYLSSKEEQPTHDIFKNLTKKLKEDLEKFRGTTNPS